MKEKREFRRFERAVMINEKSVRFLRASSYKPSKDRISKRGNIREFTRHSALRLRDALSVADVPNSDCFGVCLTVPWVCRASDFLLIGDTLVSDVYDEYQSSFNRFGVLFRRRFPNSAAIFRHELQKRKMPHCHLVVWLSSFDLPAGADVVKLKIEFFNMWYRALKYNLRGGDSFHFSRYGVDVEPLNDRLAMFRYLADHTSKHKQAQLGFPGKQWGKLQAKCFVPDRRQNYIFRSQAQLLFFSRAIRNVCRFSVSSDVIRKRMIKCRGRSWVDRHFKYNKPFGKKKIPACKMRSVNFVSSRTSLRLLDYVLLRDDVELRA